MNLGLTTELAAAYSSGLQRARVLTEPWVESQVYCPNCGHDTLTRHPNNSEIGDFHCQACSENYELKSKRTRFGAKVDDGAYQAMRRRLSGSANPSLFLLNYDLTYVAVTDFAVIPKHFITLDMVEKKNALGPTARRKGWVGCRIRIQAVPEAGRIVMVRNGFVQPKLAVRDQWRRCLFLLGQRDLGKRRWLVHIMRCIDRVGKDAFSLDEVYAFEDELRAAYPCNRHIKAKIRQQPQVLRENRYLEFVGSGSYKLCRSMGSTGR